MYLTVPYGELYCKCHGGWLGIGLGLGTDQSLLHAKPRSTSTAG